LIGRLANRSQIKQRYAGHHQQPQNDSRNDELDPSLIVREPSMHWSMMSKGTSPALNSEQDLASIPMAGGAFPVWLSRVSKAPACQWCRFSGVMGLTPEVIADPEERLSVRSQIALLEALTAWPISPQQSAP
jgi:hypothetical protein